MTRQEDKMTPENREAIDLFRSVAAEGRGIQKDWHRIEDGKEYVCLAAAWGKPGTIKSTSECPSGLFPTWVFELMPALDDGLEAKDVPWLFQCFADRAERMASLSAEQWESVRVAFASRCIDFALAKAAVVQPSPAPDFWQNVLDACEQVKISLRTGLNLDEAAEAARSAAWAAEAARAAARSALAAAWAAWAAVRAARAARAAAEAARAAARAAEEARAAARSAGDYREIAELFFTCVDEARTTR